MRPKEASIIKKVCKLGRKTAKRCFMVMFYEHVLWTCFMVMFYRHVLWTCFMDIFRENGANLTLFLWTCFMDMFYGHVL